MRFLFVCGGSAGHINPAIAIAEEMRLKATESDILFVGADKTLEKRLVPEAGFKLVNIKMSGLRRGFSVHDIRHNIITVKNLITASFKAAKLLKDYIPDAVIGTGGFICYPILKKAAKYKIPTYILEPNAFPGLTVKMLSATVDKVFVTYSGLEDRYKRPDRVVYTGTPLKREFFDIKPAADDICKKPLVVSYWGSVGATNMNTKILDFIKINSKEQKFNHIHATGISGSAETMKEKLKSLGLIDISAPTIDIREYIDDMPKVMSAASIIISRAGASTIAELTAMGKPSILIPSPNVTENHQEENARQLHNAGGAIMILENECTGETLYNTVISILDDKSELEKMSELQKSLSVYDAAARIVEIVLGKSEKKGYNAI